MKTFIRAVEVWLPDAGHTLLEWGGGLYPDAPRFGAVSRTMCFGRAEGLPGQAWELGRPLVLKKFEGSYFLRTRAAAAEGLTCGIALPTFHCDRLAAVLVIFCGDGASHAGAIELWHTPPRSPDMTLADGYYGTTAEVFEFVARQTAFRKGFGLPGLAWQSGLPVFMPDLGKGTRFIRADSAQQVGINRGLAIPCSARGDDVWVMALLSALGTPIVRRFETWLPDAGGNHLLRHEGFCEVQGTIGPGTAADRVEIHEGALGQALAQRAPAIAEDAAQHPGALGRAAGELGLRSVVALPVLRSGRVAAVVAWYF
jgi:hypothetical protein